MKQSVNGAQFGHLFKKYRLRSEIETLEEFGDLLAEEGLIYDTSLFTRWQKGERVPKERRVCLSLIKIFSKKHELTLDEANNLLNSLGQSNLTVGEQMHISIKIENNYKVLEASLGGTLKDFRVQKNISILDVSLSMGWVDTKRIEMIESGYEKPSRELMDQLCKVLSLKEAEKNHLLLVGDYLPTNTEIEIMRKKVAPILSDWKYPATLLDYSWRILDDNDVNAKIWNISSEKRQYIYEQKPRVIELLFHPDFIKEIGLSEVELEQWKQWLVKLLIHFRFAHRNRSDKGWYQNTLIKLMESSLFRELWSQTHAITEEIFITNHSIKTVMHPNNPKKRLKFFFSILPLLQDPRFEIELYMPADIETMEFFK